MTTTRFFWIAFAASIIFAWLGWKAPEWRDAIGLRRNDFQEHSVRVCLVGRARVWSLALQIARAMALDRSANGFVLADLDVL
jgi:hypothetical protein